MFGWVGAVLLALAGVPQTIKVWREGHAKGLSWWYLSLLWLGFLFMGIHSYRKAAGIALVASYSLQFLLFTLMILRKALPKP